MADSPAGVFPHSLGAFSGTPEEVAIEFSAAEAPYIREREWHPTQKLEDLPEGRVRLTLQVVVDWGLQAWIQGFGPAAIVVRPATLAAKIVKSLDEARAQYA